MGRISIYFRQFNRAFDHLVNMLERRLGRVFSKRSLDIAGRVESVGAYLKKRLPQWQGKLRLW
jgi:hypothetical protein